MEAELVPLNLNCRGIDVVVNVDLETANILLNDPEQMDKYFQELIDTGQLVVHEDDDSVTICSNATSSEHGGIGSTSNVMPCSSANQSSNKFHSELWVSKGKPTERDNMATHKLLELRKKYIFQFDDRKTIKMQLWKRIAEELCDQGFNVGYGKEGATKCRQKFANLTRTYLAHNKHKRTTGAERIDEPSFYSEMHEILGYKDKADPQNLQDSMATEENYNTSDKENDAESDDEEPFVSDTASSTSSKYKMKNRFCNIAKSVRPKNASALLLEEVKRQHEENMKQKDTQFKLFEENLTKRYDQNERMINLMERMLEAQNNNKQRKNNDFEVSE